MVCLWHDCSVIPQPQSSSITLGFFLPLPTDGLHFGPFLLLPL